MIKIHLGAVKSQRCLPLDRSLFLALIDALEEVDRWNGSLLDYLSHDKVQLLTVFSERDQSGLRQAELSDFRGKDQFFKYVLQLALWRNFIAGKLDVLIGDEILVFLTEIFDCEFDHIHTLENRPNL